MTIETLPKTVSTKLVNIFPSILEGTMITESLFGPNGWRLFNRYAPVLFHLPEIQGELLIPSVLVCTPSVVSASPHVSHTYSWYVDGVLVKQGEGPDFSFFETDEYMDGKPIKCMVRSENSEGFIEHDSNTLVPYVVEPSNVKGLNVYVITGNSRTDAVSCYNNSLFAINGMGVENCISMYLQNAILITGIGSDTAQTIHSMDVMIVTNL